MMEKNMLVLYGSPRERGFTKELLKIFIQEWENVYPNTNIYTFHAYQENMAPCTACGFCRDVYKRQHLTGVNQVWVSADNTPVSVIDHRVLCTVPIETLCNVPKAIPPYYRVSLGSSGSGACFRCSCCLLYTSFQMLPKGFSSPRYETTE